MMTIADIEKRADVLSELGDAHLDALFRSIGSAGKEIVIFGAGAAGQLVQQKLADRGIRVSAFSDNAPATWGTERNGVPVIPPDALASKPDALVVICSWDVDGIERQLRRIGVSAIEKNAYIASLAEPQRAFFREHLSKAAELEARLADEESRDVLRSLTLHALTFDGALLDAIHDPNQYFYHERFAIRPGDTVVDGGAFTGDTVADIVKRYGRTFGAIHCFEPNEKNYTELVAYLERESFGKSVVAHKLGLWDSVGELHYSGAGSSFHLSAPGEPVVETIPVSTMDSVFADTRVDFIKMDLEGAEPVALRGGENVIRRDRPRLAICVYHFPEQLWEIPLTIASLVPSYKLYLRNHTNQRRETVIYAIA